MDFDSLIYEAFMAFLTVVAFFFFFQRALYRRRKRKNKNYIGFYPSVAALSISLQSLQLMAQPDMQHVLEEQLKEAEEEDDEGDPDDPAAKLNHQLKCIRRGEPVGDLQVPLPNLSTPTQSDP